MDRRSFLENMSKAAGGVLLGLPGLNGYSVSGKSLTVLHTNDTRGHVEPLPDYAGEYGGMGGMNQRYTLVKRLRSEKSSTVLVDCGNVYGDTPYTDFYGLDLMYRMMSDMKYDAATLGHLDLSCGIRPFLDAAGKAEFPFVVSNYEIGHGDLRRFVNKYYVINKGAFRIGLFGLGLNLEACGLPEIAKEIDSRDPLLISEAMVRTLRYQQDCDLVICLSQLGYKMNDMPGRFSDLKLARNVSGIDMIAGANSKIFMKKGRKIQGTEKGVTVVSQAGYGGAMLGQTTFKLAGQNAFNRLFTSNHYIKSDQ